MSAASSAEKKVPGTLWAMARRKSPAARGIASSDATEPAPHGLPEDGDALGVAAEGVDVVPDPFERGDLVEQPAIGRGALDVRETLHADTVVEGHHDHALAVPGEHRAVVRGIACLARHVRAAVDPHHDRQAARTAVRTAARRLRRPDIHRQPVRVPVGTTHRARPAQRGGLRGRRPERGGLAHPVPAVGRVGRGETQPAHGRLREGNATEDGEAVPRPPAHNPSGGTDFRLSGSHRGSHRLFPIPVTKGRPPVTTLPKTPRFPYSTTEWNPSALCHSLR